MEPLPPMGYGPGVMLSRLQACDKSHTVSIVF